MSETIFSNYGIGMDRLFSELNRESIQRQSNYPPYNIRKIQDYKTLLEIAVAGFKEKDLEVKFAENTLTIIGKNEKEDVGEYMHSGIGLRSFSRNFVLSPDVRIDQVTLEDGMLRILLEREIPDHKKPRTIPISSHKMEIDDGISDDKLLLMEE